MYNAGMNRTLPNAGNIRPLARNVTFPYEEEWANSNVKITLACVPWDQYNLPAFTSQAELDEYIDSLPSTKRIGLDIFENKPPVFSFKCPIPYDVAQEYTYAVVHIQQVTPAKPLPFENTKAPIRRYYYFITDSSYINPNNTELTVNLDVWHTYFNLIEIGSADMKRGHLINELAPSPAEYLSNPLTHTKYLTTIDYNFGDPADRVATAEFEQFGGNGKRYLVLWGNLNPEEIGNDPEQGYHYAPIPNTVEPVFDSEGLLVNEPWWTYVAEYNEIIPIPYAPNTKGEVPNGIIAFAVDLDDAQDFMTSIDAHGMHVLNRIQGAAVLPDSMIRRGQQRNTSFGRIWLLEQPDIAMTRYVQRDLTAEKFDMPDEIKGFTKAYTYPYSHIVFCMPDGTIRNIQVEQLGSGGTSYAERLTTAFPWLNGETFLTSFKSDEDIQYTFRNMRDANVGMHMTAGAWQETLTRYEIPIFSLWRTSYTAHRADDYGRIMGQQNNAATAQKNTWYSLDTNKDNTERSIVANYNNTVDSATMAQTNANNAANTAYANTIAQTGTIRANQTRTNQNSLDNTNEGNSFTQRANTINNQLINNNLGANIDAALYSAGIQNLFQYRSLQINNDYLTAQTFIDGAATTIGGAISGAITGGASGMAIGAAGGAADAALKGINLGVTISKNNAIETFQEDVNESSFYNAYGAGEFYYRFNESIGHAYIPLGNGVNGKVAANTIQKNNIDTSSSMTYNSNVTNNNIATANDTTNNTIATTNSNALRSRDTARTNAANAYNTATGNALRSRDTARTNNQATFITGRDNNVRSYNTAMINERMIDHQEAVKPNRQHTQNGGDAMKDVDGTRGTTVRYAKQTDDALTQVARMWKRYGYSYGSRLPRKLTPATSRANSGMPCTFWQLEELVFTKPLQARYRDYLTSVFSEGVTFWHDPDFSQATI